MTDDTARRLNLLARSTKRLMMGGPDTFHLVSRSLEVEIIR
jgi:hypothetical protein